MNIWNAFPFVRYSLALILGILLSPQWPFAWDSPQIIIPIFIFLLLFTAFTTRKAHLNLFRILSGVFTLLLFVYIGGYITSLHDQRQENSHYVHVEGEPSAFSGLINSDVFESEKYFKYEMVLDAVLVDSVSRKVSGAIYLYVRKDSIPDIIPYGTRLFVNGSYFEIDGPKNPNEFDYKRYLANKNIYAQAYVSRDEIVAVSREPENSLLKLAYDVRGASSQMIKDFIPGSQESAVLNALLIGVKDFLDNEIKSAYSSAGAMHVLAVSGLHVGIIYLIASIVFGFLKKTRWGKIFFLAISLSIIWSYALITGFSPSVMRAATMFSVIIIGETAKRSANIFNSLGIAAFILLLYNPFFIYEVGFQLSFIAVFGIVMFQPPIYRLWEPSNKLLDYIWAIISVSLAAQLATFPLSVYYFNQFPTYFLLSNIIVIPASMVMLSTGLFMLSVGSFSEIAGQTIGFLLGTFVHFVNWLIVSIQGFPWPAIEWLYLSGISVFLIYLFMLYFFHGIRRFHYHAMIFSFTCLLLLFVVFHLEEYKNNTQKRMLIYQMEKQLAIDFIDGRESKFLSIGDRESLESQVQFSINPHRLASGLSAVNLPLTTVSSNDPLIESKGLYFLVWEGRRILIIGPKWKGELLKKLEVDILLLMTERIEMIDQIKYQQLIIASVEPWWKRAQVIDYLNERRMDYHDLKKSGYFEVDLTD